MYVVFVLVIVCIIAFVMQAGVPGFTEMFLLQSSDVLSRPWILVTSMFLHGDIGHLLYNMFALGLFGMILESVIGRKRILYLFFGTGILAGIGSTFLYNAALGASGAIFGLLGALAALRPHMKVFVSYIPMPMFMAAAVWAIGDFFGLFVPSGTANLAHLVGLGVGIIVGYKLREKFGQSREGREIWHIEDHLKESDVRDWEKKWMK